MLRANQLVAVLVSLQMVCGCATEDPGVAPPRDEFYFPTGIAVDPRRPILYVSNSNADLRYNGGTITALDLSRIPADLGRVADSEVDCRPDRIDASRWECPESQFIIETATVRIGDFPSELRVNQDGTRLFVPVRGQDHLAWVDVAQLAEGECEEPDACVDLRCDDSPETGCANAGQRDCQVWDCDSRHQVDYSDQRQDTLPAEPFGIFWHHLTAVHVDAEGARRTCTDGVSAVPCDCAGAPPCALDRDQPTECCEPAPTLSHVYVAHLSGGDVSYFASSAAGVELRDFSGGFFNPDSGIRGGFALAPELPGDPQSRVYVSSRVENIIASFLIRDDRQIIRSRRLSIGALDPGSDVRGIAFGPGGRVLYAVNRAPPSLVALDMTEVEDRDMGEPLWSVEVCSDPSLVKLGASRLYPDVPTAQLAYVVCFGEAQIYIIDTVTGQVVNRVVTGEGPNALELDEPNKRAFIANFAENTIGVIDLDPSHDTYLTMVLRIGMAREPEQG